MAYLRNVIYLLLLALLSPWLAWKLLTTQKVRGGLAQKFLGRAPTLPVRTGPVVWFHGVSVGEIHMLRQLVREARRLNPHWHCVISTTTDTGLEEAKKIFADLPVFYWPFDFTWAVQAALDAIRPDLVVLAESELWPNFLDLARRREIGLALVNGRMSPRSAARFQRLRWLVRSMFARLDLCAVQTEEYAEHWSALGAPHVVVTGNIKYDGAVSQRDNPRTLALRSLLQIEDDDLVLVAGSTQDPEESVLLEFFQHAFKTWPNFRLILAPRQKDRFAEVAKLLADAPCVRRSELAEPTRSPIVLLDTIGELSAAWGLADVAYVGGSLDGKRGGQNMIEPAAYGAAVVFGPHTWNFKDAVARLLRDEAAIEIHDARELHETLSRLLASPDERALLGTRANTFVRTQQGATARTVQLLVEYLERTRSRSRAA